jgi:hypothetical protein
MPYHNGCVNNQRSLIKLTRHLCLCQLNLQPAKVGLRNVLDLVLQ